MVVNGNGMRPTDMSRRIVRVKVLVNILCNPLIEIEPAI